jgi:hypothetical protein
LMLNPSPIGLTISSCSYAIKLHVSGADGQRRREGQRPLEARP